MVHRVEGEQTLIRDTQNRELAHLDFPTHEWQAFLTAATDDEL